MSGKRDRRVKDIYDLTLDGHKPFVPHRHQRPYLEAIQHNSMTIGLGPAGTGKTFVAASWASEMLTTKQTDRIILCRPLVTISEERIGFLPGDANRKMEPWTAPIFDVFYKRIGVQRTQELLKARKIEIVPFGFMRGRTFDNSIVLVDEAQNMTREQGKALVTRVGEDCTYVINGDLTQRDLREENGLEMLVEMIEMFRLPFPIIRFSERDVVRSETCRLWVDAFAKTAY